MEKKNASTIIPDSQFIALLEATKNDDQEATMKLIELFKDDIQNSSKYIHLPQEEAIASIIVEFLAYVKENW
ncbi:hypothetical protein J2Z32_004206 [Paenibacillus turicensis]|uniref:Helix-turn-helix conjugative transposon-like domain-containing protein n=1 Tax=Paenibacillus turicensis TaxID=160487 RepID=A0ABS4FY74_9BACL|nr:hypothetical protein [Paenibacillus turicensis]MBP1907531.1 hypothetical protein [Paenibacillus turicensis]